MKPPSPTVAKQRGMAIISALLITAVVAVIAAGMLTRQSVFTRSLEAEQARVQGSALLLGGLEVSRQLLRDARAQDVLTRLDQPWARPIRTAQDGEFEGRLEDLQGKFNLRNLVVREQVDLGQMRSFERLCAMIGVDARLAQRISQRVIAGYPRKPVASASGLPGPALPATQPMLRSLDQLRGIEGLDEPLLARLEQYVSIIPVTTWVNSNTASAEVLAAVVPGLSWPRPASWWRGATEASGLSIAAISSTACNCPNSTWMNLMWGSPVSGSCSTGRPVATSAVFSWTRCCIARKTRCPGSSGRGSAYDAPAHCLTAIGWLDVTQRA